MTARRRSGERDYFDEQTARNHRSAVRAANVAARRSRKRSEPLGYDPFVFEPSPNPLVDDLDLTDERVHVIWERRIRMKACRSRVRVQVVELGLKFTIVDVPTLFGPQRCKARTVDLLFEIRLR